MAVISNPTPQMLADAQAAYQSLLLGQSAREVVDANGEKVVFTAANQQRLAAHIIQLQNALSGNTPNIPPPVGFIF